MATVIWVGGQQSRPQVDTITVGSNAAGQTFTVTLNGKAVTYAATAADTTTDLVAANLAAALAASAEGEFAELSFAPSGPAVLATGPDDGAPFALTTGGTGTVSSATTTAPLSPHDVADAANYLGGSLPADGDTLVLDRGAADLRYNLAALAAVAASLVRRRTFAGRVGLPDVSERGGYPEWRPTYLELAGTAVAVEQADSDGAAAVRVKSTAGSAVTASVAGPGGGQAPGAEAVELTGLPAGSTVSAAGASVAVAPLQGQACAVATLRAVGATVRAGPGATLATVSLTGSSALLYAGCTTLTADRGGTVEVAGSAAVTTAGFDAGVLLWRSSGSFGTLTLGSDAVLDLSDAPSPVAPAAAIAVAEGAEVRDPAGRLARPYDLTLDRAQLDRVTLDLGTHVKLTVSAHP